MARSTTPHLTFVTAGMAMLVMGLAAGQLRADTVTVVVPGTSDPWLAGMPAGSTASSGDTAPAHSPVLVPLTPNPGTDVLFFAIGSVSNTPSPSGLTPDGGAVTSHGNGAQNGISDVAAPVNSLVGLFLDANQPNLTAAPAALNFGTAASRDYLTLSPLLKQVFFIGDGKTSGNVQQEVVVPAGATRLFLGTMDGFGWFNNSGSFTVTITADGAGVVPLPAALWGGVVLLGGVGLSKRRRR